MNAFLGIIRPNVSAHYTDKDDLCFQKAAHKFPAAFKSAQKISTSRLNISGNFKVSGIRERSSQQLFFNGAIFNHTEIIAALGTSQQQFGNDADLVHALILAKGIASVRMINGQFIIIYYEPQQQKISIINDHLGIQQVLYHHDKNMFLLGSEVKYLQTHPDCPKGIDWEAALKRPGPHIVLGAYKSYKTWFNGINLLPEASILELYLETGKSGIKTYWKPQLRTGALMEDKRIAAVVMDEYAALLEDAVRVRMESNRPTHCLLSGGLDSSAICGLAVKHGPIETYSIISQTTVLEYTTFFCHSMSEELKFKNTQFLVPYRELCFNARLWKQRVWRAESPVNHTDSLTKTLLHYAISKNNPGVKNLLTGTGSDQMNGGLVGYIAAVADTKEESWANFYNEILDVEHRKIIRRDEEALWQLRKFIDRDFLSSVSDMGIENNPWMTYMDGAIHSQAYSLLWDEQRASSSHGHTTYYPFLDYRIAEFIAAVPHHLHKDLFYDKQILREPAKKFVPEYIINKPKMPYNLPEYDFRAQLYEFLTADNDTSLFREAFGDVDSPHPVINKRQLYSRIVAMRQKPDMLEWLNIMHIINLGLLEKLSEQDEASLDYEPGIDAPMTISFDDPAATKSFLEKRLGIMSNDELIDKPVRFGENCSLLLDTKNNKYYLSKRNNLAYEIEDEYATWKNFLVKIDNKLSARQILDGLGVEYSAVEEFFRLSLKEQILVTTDKSTGY